MNSFFWILFRQCACCFKDPKNFDRFNALVQGLALSVIEILQQIAKDVKSPKSDSKPNNDSPSKNSESKKTSLDTENKTTDSTKEKDKNVSNSSAEETEKDPSPLKTAKKDIHEEDWSLWTNEDKEKILNIFSKVFLLNFPLYMAFKHSMQSKLDVSIFFFFFFLSKS